MNGKGPKLVFAANLMQPFQQAHKVRTMICIFLERETEAQGVNFFKATPLVWKRLELILAPSGANADALFQYCTPSQVNMLFQNILSVDFKKIVSLHR